MRQNVAKAQDIYDKVTGPCDCGSTVFIAYDASIIGGVEIINKTQIGIKHFDEPQHEQEKLLICPRCTKVKYFTTVTNAYKLKGE